MNIYDFFNSRDIAEHCRKINHKLTALETTYIVWLCEKKTLKEKHEAWRYIVKNFPDEELPPATWADDEGGLIRSERSLHRFLEHYMQIENECIESFYIDNDDYIFDYGIRYTYGEEYLCDDVFYNNFEACYNDMVVDMASEDAFEARVTKRKLYSSRPNGEQEIHTVHFNKNKEIVEISSPILDNDWALIDGFSSMCPEIPTPFKIGDLVTSNSVNGKRGSTFVLAYVPYWDENEKGHDMTWLVERLRKEGGDWTDMQSSVYAVDETGDIYWTHGPNYLHLEYCRSVLTWKDRILFALGNYLKKKINVQEFLTAQSIIKAEATATEKRLCFVNAEDIKRFAGLE